MHHEAPQEFFAPQAEDSSTLFFKGLIAERYVGIVLCQKPVIGNRDTLDLVLFNTSKCYIIEYISMLNLVFYVLLTMKRMMDSKPVD